MSSRVSTKIQQLLNTLKRPKRPPLKEFFVDDFEEIVEGNSTQCFCESFLMHAVLYLFMPLFLMLTRIDLLFALCS